MGMFECYVNANNEDEIKKVANVEFILKAIDASMQAINNSISGKINKNGDTVTGVLNVPTPALPS
jgi:hypothetical protein